MKKYFLLAIWAVSGLGLATDPGNGGEPPEGPPVYVRAMPGSGAGDPPDDPPKTLNGYEIIDVPSLKGLSIEDASERYGIKLSRDLITPKTNRVGTEKYWLFGWRRVKFYFNNKGGLQALAFICEGSHSLEDAEKIAKENLNIDLATTTKTKNYDGFGYSDFNVPIDYVGIKMDSDFCRWIIVRFDFRSREK